MQIGFQKTNYHKALNQIKPIQTTSPKSFSIKPNIKFFVKNQIHKFFQKPNV